MQNIGIIIVVGSPKGGVGKSTQSIHIAAHLANTGKPTILVDADDRQSSQKWVQRRHDAGAFAPIVAASLHGNIAEKVKLLAQNFAYVVVDCGGTKSPELLSVLGVADILLTPFRPTDVDIDVFQYMNGLVKEKRMSNPKLRPFLLTNEAPSNASNAALERLMADVRILAKSSMDEYKLIDVAIKTRAIYQTCYGEGATVHDYAKQNKLAVDEMNQVFKEILQ